MRLQTSLIVALMPGWDSLWILLKAGLLSEAVRNGRGTPVETSQKIDVCVPFCVSFRVFDAYAIGNPSCSNTVPNLSFELSTDNIVGLHHY